MTKFTTPQWRTIGLLIFAIITIAAIAFLYKENQRLKQESKTKALKTEQAQIKADLDTNAAKTNTVHASAKKAAKRAVIEADRVIEQSKNYTPVKSDYEAGEMLVNYGK